MDNVEPASWVATQTAQMAQQNAALGKESAVAAESLKELATHLAQVFRISA